MKLLLHLMTTDVRRFRLVLGIWAMTVVALAVVDGMRPTLVQSASTIETLGLAGGLLSIASLALMIVLVPSIVQADAVVGEEAFWMTRPIPPSVLLLSKIVLLWIALVFAPVAVQSALMLAYRVPAQPLAFVLLEQMLFQTLWLALLMAAAALTPNLARFALLCGAVLLALAMLAAILIVVQTIVGEPVHRFVDPPVADSTGALVLILLLIATAGALLIVQYRTRLRVRAAAVGLAGLVMLPIVGHVWPWPMLVVRAEVPSWASDPSTIRLTGDPETVESKEETYSFREDEAWRFVYGKVQIAGLPPHWSAHLAAAESAMQIPSGPRLTSEGGSYAGAAIMGGFVGGPSPGTRAVARDLLGLNVLGEAHVPPVESTILLRVGDLDFERVAPAEGTYEGRFHVILAQHEIEAVLPLESGATHQSDAYRVVVNRTARIGSSVAVLVTHSDAWSMFDTRPRPQHSYYLRNPQAGEAVAGYSEELREMPVLSWFLPNMAFGTSTPTSGFFARGLRLRFPAPYAPPEEPLPLLDRAWMDGAELVIVRAVFAGSVQRWLRIENFPLRETPRRGPMR